MQGCLISGRLTGLADLGWLTGLADLGLPEFSAALAAE